MINILHQAGASASSTEVPCDCLFCPCCDSVTSIFCLPIFHPSLPLSLSLSITSTISITPLLLVFINTICINTCQQTNQPTLYLAFYITIIRSDKMPLNHDIDMNKIAGRVVRVPNHRFQRHGTKAYVHALLKCESAVLPSSCLLPRLLPTRLITSRPTPSSSSAIMMMTELHADCPQITSHPQSQDHFSWVLTLMTSTATSEQTLVSATTWRIAS